MARRCIVLCVFALLALVPRVARADRVDALTTSLLGDPSWRVKVQAAITLGRLKTREPRAVQALIEALRDGNEAVRAVAAETLGKIGDASAREPLRVACSDGSPGVRVQAKRALGALERSGAATGAGAGAGGGGDRGAGPHWFVAIADIAPGKADVEAARKVRDRATRELGRVSGLTLDPAASGPRARYWIDGNITGLGAGQPDQSGRVHTDCGVRMILATLPDKSIRMMASLESSVEGTADQKDLDGARNDCLVDLGKQISEKVQAYLETHR